jgi:hypothetical protein
VLISHVISILVYFPLCPPGNWKISPKVGNMTNLILYLLLEIAFWITPNVWHIGCETSCIWICMFYLKWLYYHLSVRIMLQWKIVSSFVSFQIITAASMMTGFWDTAPCILVEVDRRFIALMMWAVCTSETSFCFDETTRRHIPETCHVQ